MCVCVYVCVRERVCGSVCGSAIVRVILSANTSLSVCMNTSASVGTRVAEFGPVPTWTACRLRGSSFRLLTYFGFFRCPRPIFGLFTHFGSFESFTRYGVFRYFPQTLVQTASFL